jgi:hypothetical protein
MTAAAKPIEANLLDWKFLTHDYEITGARMVRGDQSKPSLNRVASITPFTPTSVVRDRVHRHIVLSNEQRKALQEIPGGGLRAVFVKKSDFGSGVADSRIKASDGWYYAVTKTSLEGMTPGDPHYYGRTYLIPEREITWVGAYLAEVRKGTDDMSPTLTFRIMGKKAARMFTVNEIRSRDIKGPTRERDDILMAAAHAFQEYPQDLRGLKDAGLVELSEGIMKERANSAAASASSTTSSSSTTDTSTTAADEDAS